MSLLFKEKHCSSNLWAIYKPLFIPPLLVSTPHFTGIQSKTHTHPLTVCSLPYTGSLRPARGHTSEFIQLSIDGVYDEHVRSLVARRHRGADQRQRTTGLLALPLLIDKVLQLSQLWIQHKIPAQEEKAERENEVKKVMNQGKDRGTGNGRSTVTVIIIILFYALIILFTGKNVFYIFLLHKLCAGCGRE